MSPRRPVIGICAALIQARWDVWDQPAVLLSLPYVTAVQRAGGMAVMIPPDHQLERDPGEVLDLLDALILAGGADVDPASYGAQRHPMTTDTVPERDRTELALTRAAVQRDMPVLGICRGMQLLNVAFGGTLKQHLPEEYGHEDHRRFPGTFDGADHDVRLIAGSVAAAAAGEELHATKSHHHQGVDEIGAGLAVTGVSMLDELPEAIEHTSRRFVLGVQWHPEVDDSSGVVAALVGQARDYRSRRDWAAPHAGDHGSRRDQAAPAARDHLSKRGSS
jgi:putative glutamine amidotransferase